MSGAPVDGGGKWVSVGRADCHAGSIQTGVIDSTSRSSPRPSSAGPQQVTAAVGGAGRAGARRIGFGDWFRCRAAVHVTDDVTDAADQVLAG